MRGTFCVLPREICFVPWDLACERNWLKVERSTLTAKQKSAEGIVGLGFLKTEGPNGTPRGE
jgi:hypothetical protein